ncbi:MAG TPA: hypothetical protein VMV52_03895 [Candidatus Nanopelagicaceae bacterium]|nr:hypothetical protein [Candidatus Nanopelagicaceae bacterium]
MNANLANKGKRRAIVAILLSGEAAAVLALGAFLVAKSLISTPEAPWALVGEVVFALLAGLGLLLSAHGFRTNRNYGRSPAILVNLIALGVAYFQISAHFWVLAVPMSLVAAVTVGLALSIIPEDPA